MFKKGVAILFCMLPLLGLLGQSLSNIRYNAYAISSDTIYLDSLSIVPETALVRASGGITIDTSAYQIKAFESILIWKIKPLYDSVKVFYRVYPFSLGRPAYNKSYSQYMQASANSLIRPFTYTAEDAQIKLIDFGSLDYNGVFARGISFGSNQSVVLNSQFNLQLSGMLTRELELTAAVTDNSIPIQPEGNTQQLQEFDKIFIQLRQGRQKLIVGDFDLFNATSDYFMKFSKKYQGGYYSGAFDVKKVGIIKTAVAGGISRGKFSRNTLQVSEGNQGPYKLQGANGETFIVILANTEEVFVNGVKMERGADRDYTIDYNLGEITFMPRKIITKDLRVLVEFEYSERNYLRSTAFANTELDTKQADVFFSLYSEQDSKGQNIQQNLDANKKLFLSTIGDSLQNALYKGWDSVSYDANRILYRLVPDSLGFDTVFVYSADTSVAKYAVNFSYVGAGNGDYLAASSTANGRVYTWVAPYIDSSGLHHQGAYVPYIYLVTPKYQQMYTLGTEVRLDKNNTVLLEGAMSNTDNNMYSKKNDKDNLGFAGRATFKGNVVTKVDSLLRKNERFTYEVHYEFLQNRFNTIERFRNIEFSRDWNLATSSTRYNEHLAYANVGYWWTGLGNITCRFKTFIQDSVYKGFENGLSGNFSKHGFNLTFYNSYLYSSSLVQRSDYVRPKADLYYASAKTKGWKIGALFDHEINMLKSKPADTLSAASYLWQNYKVYATTSDSAQNRFGFELTIRNEHHSTTKGFDKAHFMGQTINVLGQINSLKNQTINYTLTYRHAKETDTINTTQPEHFYLARIDYNFTLLKGFIRSTTLYEIGSGRQQKVQLSYQRSPTNQGDFVWIGDLNENGVQDVNEFGPKTGIDTVTYARVFITPPEFISVNSTQFNQVLNINPAAIWRNKKDFRKVISMFSLFASVSLNKKTFAAKGKNAGEYFNPIPLARYDSLLVSTAITSRNTLYFNRLDSKYGAQFDFNYARNRTLLTTGFENRTVQSQGVSARWNAFMAFNMIVAYVNGVKANESDFYKNLRYRFLYNDVSTDLSYQFKTYLRISAKYEFSHKINPTDTVGKQIAQVHKVTFAGRYNRLNKSTVDASLSYATIVYNDKSYRNEQLEYAMLEGLRNGNNLVWSLSYSQNLGNNIQLTVSYDGRMTGFAAGDKSTVNPVHTGRVELRALF